MKKVLLTAAMLIAGMVGFNSCGDDEVATPNAGTENPGTDSSKEDEDDGIDEEAAEGKLNAIDVGVEGPCCFSPLFFDGSAIGMGKSFRINNPTKSMNDCFTQKSRNQQASRQIKEGEGSKVEIYYTSNDYEYNSLKSDKISGGVSFLNFASFNESYEQQISNTSSRSNQRLVFVATKDFGQFEFPNELLLTKDAFAQLKDGDFAGFKANYGTHYIWACQKKVQVFVTIEIKNSENSFGQNQTENTGVSGSYKGVKAYVEYDKSSNKYVFEKKEDYHVETEFYCPEISGITECVDNAVASGENFASKLYEFLLGKIKDFKDTDAKVTQYYAKPFSMLGCQDVIWTKNKEDKLAVINKNIFEVENIKNMIGDYTTQNMADVLFLQEEGEKPLFYNDLLSYLSVKYPCDLSEDVKTELQLYYSSADLVIEWKALQADAKSLLAKLEEQYDKCIDIAYNVVKTEEDFSDEVKELEDKYNTLYDKGYKATQTIVWGYILSYAIYEAQFGTIQLTNDAKCNFSVEISGPDDYYYSFEMAGKATKSFKLKTGSYIIHTYQLDGYAFYPTEDYETIEVESARTTDYSFYDHN